MKLYMHAYNIILYINDDFIAAGYNWKSRNCQFLKLHGPMIFRFLFAEMFLSILFIICRFLLIFVKIAGFDTGLHKGVNF